MKFLSSRSIGFRYHSIATLIEGFCGWNQSYDYSEQTVHHKNSVCQSYSPLIYLFVGNKFKSDDLFINFFLFSVIGTVSERERETRKLSERLSNRGLPKALHKCPQISNEFLNKYINNWIQFSDQIFSFFGRIWSKSLFVRKLAFN